MRNIVIGVDAVKNGFTPENRLRLAAWNDLLIVDRDYFIEHMAEVMSHVLAKREEAA